MDQQRATSHQEQAFQLAGQQEEQGAQENFTAEKGKSFRNLTFTSQYSPIVSRSSIETLQKTIGNKAVQRLIQNQKESPSVTVQRKEAAGTIQRDPEEIERIMGLERDVERDGLEDRSAPDPAPSNQAADSPANQKGNPSPFSGTGHLGSLPEFRPSQPGAPKPKRFSQASAADSAVNGTKSAFTVTKVAHSQLSNFLSTIKEWIGKGPSFGMGKIDIAMGFLSPVVTAVGIDLLELFRYIYLLKTQRALLKELKAEKKTITEKGDSSDLAKAVLHSYGKINRSVNTKWISVIKGILGMVGRLITLVSGGTAALVSEALVILKDIMSLAQVAFRSVKGIYKYVKGTKGKGRATSARTFLLSAASGEKLAARFLLKMDLYGIVQKATKKVIGKDTKAADSILKEIAALAKTPEGENKVEGILVNYTGAPEAVRKIVEEKVADQLKSF